MFVWQSMINWHIFDICKQKWLCLCPNYLDFMVASGEFKHRVYVQIALWVLLMECVSAIYLVMGHSLEDRIIPRQHFRHGLWAHKWNFKKQIGSNLYFSESIRPNECALHDRSLVLLCGKLSHNRISDFNIKAILACKKFEYDFTKPDRGLLT